MGWIARNDKRIPEMGAEELKKYLCPLAYGKMERCQTCPSRESCSAGKRANELTKQAEEIKEKAPEKAHKGGWNTGTMARVEAAREECDLVLSEKNPIQALMDLTGVNQRAAEQRIRVWESKYADIFEKHGLDKKIVFKIFRDCAKAKKEPEKLPEEKIEAAAPEETQNDEISVEDLLKDFDAEGESDPPVETAAQEMNPDGKLVGLDELYERLSAEQSELRAQIEKIGERIAWLEEQKEAVDKVRCLLDQSTAIGKSLTLG